MEYEDRVTIATPEGVEIELPLAGVGSRSIAALIDNLLKLVLVGILVGVLVAAGGLGGELGAGAALVAVASFAALFLFDVLFETFAAGQTPGKRLVSLRVVRTGGDPVGLRASCVRNLVRAIEGLPLSYVPAMIAVLATRRNQRLGDLAAGTLVVRERRAADPAPTPGPGRSHRYEPQTAWDVSGVSAQELTTVRRFLDRRADIDEDARIRLGRELAGRLRPRVAGAPDDLAAEEFLEGLVAAKLARG